jgi:hypothetical protein
METIINIPAKFEQIAFERLQTLENKAKKIGIEFSYSFGASLIIDNELKTPVILRSSEDIFKIKDHEFIGSLCRKDNVLTITEVPGKTIPVDLRDSFACDHCGIARFRNQTYILQNTVTQKFLVIGSSCLDLYLGINPKNAINGLNFLNEIGKVFSDNFEGEKECLAFDLRKYLAVTNQVINAYGWVSAAQAKQTGNLSTADRVVDLFFGRYNQVEIPESDYEVADKIISWLKNLEQEKIDHSSYLFNCLQTIVANRVIARTFNLASSIVITYLRENEKQVKEQKQSISEYVGKVGGKVNLMCNLKNHVSLDTNFGTLHIFIFQSNNNVLVWKTSTMPYVENTRLSDLDKNVEICLIGTVKEHTVYRDTKQTILTRCKVA